MIIREVNINDADALSEIYKYYVDNFPYSFEYVAPSAEEFAERIADISEKFPFFVCEDNGEIIGFAYAHKFKERKAYQWVCETSIYVKNGCTQKGVGKLLYENLLPALKQQGFVKAFAVLGCPNEGSEIFHQKMGFSFVSTLPNIGYKLGSWHDIKYYVLELNPFRDDMPEPLEYHQIKQEKETYETDEERQARIYPVILSEYNPAWPEWYAGEKTNLERLIGTESIARISHFGSTSVPGLAAKPTVDILLEIQQTTDIAKLITSLPQPEYICLNPPDMPTPPPHLMFLKGYLPDGFAEKVYHIHVRYSGDWDELYFRDYLIVHPETTKEYGELKTMLKEQYEHDRDGYTIAKSEFIKKYTMLARKDFEGRSSIEKSFLLIQRACINDIENIENLYNKSIEWLDNQGIHQWKRDIYPTKRSALEALQRGSLYCCIIDRIIIGTFIIDEHQPKQYSSLKWKYQSNNTLTLHTLVIKPGYSGQGYGKSVMEFVIDYAVKNNYKAIRLDVFPGNKSAKALYNKFGFELAGKVFFDIKDPGYEWYDCYEKLITEQ